jgi:carbohydrate kinase (thermoresistant glucokinase family)
MGVSGSGKTTVGEFVAQRLRWDLVEGDAMHPTANIAKMASGHPLNDEDRWPWLERIAAWIGERTATGEPGIVTCSALKRKYRDLLRRPGVVFVFLAASKERIAERLARREGHFMPSHLLDSQFADLEPPEPDENAITVDASRGVGEQGEEIVARLGLIDGDGPPA